jgi:copper transport protein
VTRFAVAAGGGSPLDDFLAGTDRERAGGSGELLRDLGVGTSMMGLLLAIGVVAVLARVHRGSEREVAALRSLASFGAVLVAVGGVIELAGLEAVFETGWTGVLSLETSSAAMMRVVGGTLVAFGLGATTVTAGAVTTGTAFAAAHQVRWNPGAESAFGLVGLAVAAFSFSFDGHTVTEGPRGLHMVADLVHVVAGGVWFGGVVALVALAVLRHRTGTSIAEAVVRFSSVATAALAAVAVAGSVMAVIILDSVDELTDTVWGRQFTIKLVAVGVATALGGYHHLVTVRRLDGPGSLDPAELARARTTLVVEALALAFVLVATSFLVNASTA